MPCLKQLALKSTAVVVALLCTAAVSTAGIVNVPVPTGDIHIPVTSLQEARFRSTIEQERDYSCGSAAVATLLTYHYEFPVAEQDVFQVMYQKGDQEKIRREGFSLLDIKHYLEFKGFRADGFRLPFGDFARMGVPAIVLINDSGYRHFVVIKGVERRYVLVGDPGKGTRIVERDRFETMWNGIAFVIRNNRQIGLAHFNTPGEWQIAAQAPLNSVLARNGIATFTLSLPTAYEF